MPDQAAYIELSRIDPAGTLPLQRWAELTAVAELIHLKVSRLPVTDAATLQSALPECWVVSSM